MAIGLFLVRRRRNKLSLGPSEFRAWDVVVLFNVIANLYILIMPWYPPPKGGADVSFWYGTYVVVGIAIVLLCGVYYAFWVYLLPKWGGYTIRQEIVELDHGATTHRLLKVKNEELVRWDETHDAVGRSLASSRSLSLEKEDGGGKEEVRVGTVGV